jgi:hypothetical protein
VPLHASTNAHILAARAALSRAHAFPASDWPPESSVGLDRSGLYAWYLDRAGAAELTIGYDLPVRATLAYLGEAGVNSEADLRQRIECHLGGCRLQRSTLRRTLACGLLRQRGWRVVAHRTLAPLCEQELTSWMRTHLRVAVHPFEDRVELADLERLMIRRLAPQLNLPLSKKADTPLVARIRKLRKKHDLQ